MKLIIREIYGECPVQGEGTIDGVEFYFRARHNRWSLTIGDWSLPNGEWFYAESYGSIPHEAGYMTEDEARAFIQKAAKIYVRETK